MIATAQHDLVMATGGSSAWYRNLWEQPRAPPTVDYRCYRLTDTPGHATGVLMSVLVVAKTAVNQRRVGPAMLMRHVRHRPMLLLSSRPLPEVTARAAVG